MLKSLALAAAVAGLSIAAAPAQADLKEVNFGIISTESSKNLKQIWEPFLADMEKKTGYKVNSFFASDYAGIIEAMRFNKVQLAWYGNKSAIEAVDRANGEVFVQTVDVAGNPGYWSVVITHKDSKLRTIDDLIGCAKECSFGNGDPNSTSGFAVPAYYIFTLRNIDPKAHFKRMTTANHETNALTVSNQQIDAATFNTESWDRFKKTQPERAAMLREIWRSPLIASDPIVWRKDLPGFDKQKIRDFFLTYGTKDTAEKEVLAGLQWAPFRASSNKQLIPIRQIELARALNKLKEDATIPADERQTKVAEIERKLSELNKEMAN